MAAIQRKKDGGPNLKFFECLETIAQLEPVRVWLLKNAKKVYFCFFLIFSVYYMPAERLQL